MDETSIDAFFEDVYNHYKVLQFGFRYSKLLLLKLIIQFFQLITFKKVISFEFLTDCYMVKRETRTFWDEIISNSKKRLKWHEIHLNIGIFVDSRVIANVFGHIYLQLQLT